MSGQRRGRKGATQLGAGPIGSKRGGHAATALACAGHCSASCRHETQQHCTGAMASLRDIRGPPSCRRRRRRRPRQPRRSLWWGAAAPPSPQPASCRSAQASPMRSRCWRPAKGQAPVGRRGRAFLKPGGKPAGRSRQYPGRRASWDVPSALQPAQAASSKVASRARTSPRPPGPPPGPLPPWPSPVERPALSGGGRKTWQPSWGARAVEQTNLVQPPAALSRKRCTGKQQRCRSGRAAARAVTDACGGPRCPPWHTTHACRTEDGEPCCSANPHCLLAAVDVGLVLVASCIWQRAGQPPTGLHATWDAAP